MLRLMPLVVAALSALSGAVMAVLPALVVGFVTLFYNSAGGVLIFLGNLIDLLPNSFGAAGGGASLPLFQQLDTHAVAVVLRSATATILCSVALVVLASMRGAPLREGNSRSWLLVGFCCLLAAVAGGRLVALAVLPAIVSSSAHLVRQRMRSGG